MDSNPVNRRIMVAFRRFLAILGIAASSTAAFAGTPDFDLTPDKPEQFGYKTNWFAVKTDDTAAVINALGFGVGEPANWESGVSAAYGYFGSPGKKAYVIDKNRAWIFVSPSVKGWVFIIGYSLPYPVMHNADRFNGIGQKFDIVFSRLTSHFSEVQFFGSDRRVGFVAWACALQGKPTRIFAFGDGDVYANVGNQTKEEKALGFLDLSGLSPRTASERLFSVEGSLFNEDAPLKLAALWSLDPDHLPEIDTSPGLGRVIELPARDFMIELPKSEQ